MKRTVLFFLFLLILIGVTGCAKKEGIGTKIEKKNPIKEAIEKQVKQANNEKDISKKEKQDRKKTKEEEEIDDQLAKLQGRQKNNEEELFPSDQDLNPTDEGIEGNPGGNNFAEQFGETEFDRMLDEAKNMKKQGEFDYDLTNMNSDMVYATVFLMMTDPDSFKDKKFKMRGQYYAAFYEPTNQHYHYCFISDAAGCCQQGIEFAVDPKLKYPDDFPEDGTDIMVSGVFEKYSEDGKNFVRLKNAEIKVESENKK